MDTQTKVKEEYLLSDSVASQNEREMFTNNVTTKNDAMLLNNDCDVVAKNEINSDSYSQKNRENFPTQPLNLNKFETIICSNIVVKPEIGSQNEKAFLPEEPVMNVQNDNSDHEMENKMEVKVEPWWLQEESSSDCDDMKDGDFTSVKSPRFCAEAVYGDSSGDSLLPSINASGENTSFRYGKYPECESQETVVTKTQAIVTYANAKQSDRCSDKGKFSRGVKKLHKCQICDKSFTRLSHLKLHNLIHEGIKPNKCEICDKRFTQFSALNRHYSTHEGKRPHKCNICDKDFTQLSSLKLHSLIHEGKKPHKCNICEKSFTLLSHLKRHILIHEGLKPYRCELCEKTFTQLSALNRHNLIHEGIKPHKCEICGKSFTHLCYWKRHNMLHENIKPYKCEICEKSFTQLSILKKHKLIHERQIFY